MNEPRKVGTELEADVGPELWADINEMEQARQERRAAEERLRRVRALSPFIEARRRRMEALKYQNGFAEKIHKALVPGGN